MSDTKLFTTIVKPSASLRLPSLLNGVCAKCFPHQCKFDGQVLHRRRRPVAQAEWDAFDPAATGGFAAWLPGFYGAVEAAAEGDALWLGPVLPEQAAALVATLLAAVFSRTDKSFRMRLSSALSLGAVPGACLPTAGILGPRAERAHFEEQRLHTVSGVSAKKH